MAYTTFNKKDFDALKEPMFFGENVNVSRYDQQKHSVFESLIEGFRSWEYRIRYQIDLLYILNCSNTNNVFF